MAHHKLTLKPTGDVLLIEEGKNVLEFLREKDIYIKSSCGGHATCTDCIVKIVSGEDNISPSPFSELKLLGNVFHLTKERMACQLSITGDVTLDIAKHDKARDEKKTSSKKHLPKKSPTKVRKEQEVHEIHTERAAFRAERGQQKEEWQKHWEKEPTKASEKSKAKNLGGNKSPKYFNTDKIDYEKKDFSRPLPEKKRLEKEEREAAAKATDKEFGTFRKNNNNDKK